MKRGRRRRIRIIDVFVVLATRVIFLGLILWGFALYLENEWIIVRWPW